MNDVSSSDTQLGALLDRYQRMRDANPHARIEAMRGEAGALYAELADLAACLDAVQGGGAPVQAKASPRTSRWKRWGGLVLLLTVTGAALTMWIATRPGPAHLRIKVHPKAPVRVEGLPLGSEPLAPGTYRIQVERTGFVPQTFTAELSGEDVTRTVHLVPLDPFAFEPLQALAKSYGVVLRQAREALPRPVGIGTRVDEKHVLRMAHPEAFGMELRRFPEAVRARDDIHYIAMRKLFRAGLFAESYHAARALTERHPDRREPWVHCARALWGLELVESELYAEVLKRMDAARARQ